MTLAAEKTLNFARDSYNNEPEPCMRPRPVGRG